MKRLGQGLMRPYMKSNASVLAFRAVNVFNGLDLTGDRRTGR